MIALNGPLFDTHSLSLTFLLKGLILSCLALPHHPYPFWLMGTGLNNSSRLKELGKEIPSPDIFILCMEYLAWLIQVEVNGGRWTGIKASRNGPSFTHQFFVDDLILFAKANRKSCQAIKKVLDTFCKASGQNINSAKSKVFLPPHASNASIDMVRRELGFGISKSFGKYLGVPIVVDGKDRHAFDFLVEKIQGKLAGWKSRTLFLIGWCMLINSVTSTIPTHIMQYCLLPNPLCKRLDRLNREFLWGDTAVTKKLHLLNWKVVTRPKEEGGMGIKCSRCRNLALLAKRNWDLRLGSPSR
jgi:hypothetical protein